MYHGHIHQHRLDVNAKSGTQVIIVIIIWVRRSWVCWARHFALAPSNFRWGAKCWNWDQRVVATIAHRCAAVVDFYCWWAQHLLLYLIGVDAFVGCVLLDREWLRLALLAIQPLTSLLKANSNGLNLLNFWSSFRLLFVLDFLFLLSWSRLKWF